MSGQHALLPPSDAHRWVNCPGSAQLQAQQPPQPDSDDARQGEASHEIGAALIRGEQYGAIASNGVMLDADMIAGAQLYANHVLSVCKQHDMAPIVEQRVHMPGISLHNWGTSDCRAWNAAQPALHVWDYKYGHRYVDAWENWQCIDYAVGALQEMAPAHLLTPATEVHIHVVQPRNYDGEGPIRTWSTRVDALQPYFDRLLKAGTEATKSDARLIPGTHCRDCKAAGVCPAINRAALWIADHVKLGRTLDPTPAEAGAELNLLNEAAVILETLKTVREEQVIAFIKDGKPVPGWGMKSTTGRETWNAPEAQVLAMGEAFGVPVSKPKLLTPNQVREQVLHASLHDVRDTLLASYVSRPSGIKLTNISDFARKTFN